MPKKKKPHRSRGRVRRVRKNPSDLAERLLAQQAKEARREGVEDSPELFTLEEIEDFLDYCMEAERSAEVCLAEVDLFDVNGSNASVEAVWDKVVGNKTFWQATATSAVNDYELEDLGLYPTENLATEAGAVWLARYTDGEEDYDSQYDVEEVLGRVVVRLRYTEGTARLGVLRDYAEDESVNEESLSKSAHIDVFSRGEMEEFPELAQLHDEFVDAGWEPSGTAPIRMTYTRRPPPWER